MPCIEAFSQQAGAYLQPLGSGRLTRPQQRHLMAYVLARVEQHRTVRYRGQKRPVRRLAGLLRHWLRVDLAYGLLRLQTAGTRDTATPTPDQPRLIPGQLRQLAQQAAERHRLCTLIAVWEQTHSYPTIFQAAGI
jgi:hypothetical protein